MFYLLCHSNVGSARGWINLNLPSKCFVYYVIPTWGVRGHGIYNRQNIGSEMHRFHSHALINAGMTCLSEPMYYMEKASIKARR